VVDDKILVRVRQLIALATRNPEKEEARTAAVQACALIVEHKLDELFRTKGQAACSVCGHQLTNVLCGVCARGTIFERWRRAPAPQPQPYPPRPPDPRKRVAICRMCGQSDVPEGTVTGGYCNRCRPFGEWSLTCRGCDRVILGSSFEHLAAEAYAAGWRHIDGHALCPSCKVPR
jgi:hypothetical protein